MSNTFMRVDEVAAEMGISKSYAYKQEEVKRQEQRLKELAPAVEGMEQLAARFSDDPEQILPEPGTLESGKAYREKKAKPLTGKCNF